MSNRGKLVEFLMAFFAEDKFGWEAFFSPPLFGFLSVLLGMVTKSKRELSVKEILFRRALHLLLIELLIFGMNYETGMQFDVLFSVTLAFSVAAVFVAVYVVMWLNDRKSAALFNEKLKEYQGRI